MICDQKVSIKLEALKSKFFGIIAQTYLQPHYGWKGFSAMFTFQLDNTKVPILKEVNFGKMKLCRVEHFYSFLGVIADHAQKWV